MKQTLIALMLTLAVAGVARAADISTLVDPYLKVHAALAADSMDFKADAAAVAKAATALGKDAAPVATAAGDVEKAADIKAARSAFSKLSDALITYANDSKSGLGDGNHVAYCSMVKSSWVQKGSKIVNPYGGKAMIGCGEIKK